jgi:hypothetical protein
MSSPSHFLSNRWTVYFVAKTSLSNTIIVICTCVNCFHVFGNFKKPEDELLLESAWCDFPRINSNWKSHWSPFEVTHIEFHAHLLEESHFLCFVFLTVGLAWNIELEITVSSSDVLSVHVWSICLASVVIMNNVDHDDIHVMLITLPTRYFVANTSWN